MISADGGTKLARGPQQRIHQSRSAPWRKKFSSCLKGHARFLAPYDEDTVMDLEALVNRARGGDVKAFVELTRRFQHAAYGSALTLVRDFQTAEDVVQEAFLAAWSGLPRLADPAAFPAWLRGIVRHQAFRVLRRRQPDGAPLADAETVPSE